MLGTAGSGPVAGACCTTESSPAGVREGSHSGRNVEITNSTATATVAACAKMSQRRTMEGPPVYGKSLEDLSAYSRNRGHLQGPPLESPTFALSRCRLITTPSP